MRELIHELMRNVMWINNEQNGVETKMQTNLKTGATSDAETGTPAYAQTFAPTSYWMMHTHTT
jgi:hypothetical protein